MPAPLIVGAIAGVSALAGTGVAMVGREYARAFLKKQLFKHRDDIEKWALSAVFEQFGFPDLTGENVDRKSFTEAINQKFLSDSGFRFTNLFDQESVKRDAFKFGVQRIAEEAGLTLEDVSEQGLVDALRRWVVDLIGEELTNEDLGELTQDAKDVWEIVQTWHKYKQAADDGMDAEDKGRKPLINTPGAQSNRERQARYRAAHKKIWVWKEGAENG